MSREMMDSHSDLNGAGRSQSQSPSQSAASASVSSSSHRKRKLPPSSDDHASLIPPSSLATFSAETIDDLDSTSAAGGGAEESDYYEGSDVAIDDDEDNHDASSIRNFTASRLKNVGVASAASRRNKKVKIDDLVKVKTPEAGKDGGSGAAMTNSDSMGAGGTALEGVGKEDTEKSLFTDNIQKSGAYTAREEILKREEEAGRLKFTCVSDDGRDEHMVWLIDLKNIFSKQLPKMPKEYIVRLVMDRNHKSVMIIRNGHVVGGITYRPYIRQKFGEMVFCAIATNEQVKGYGTRLMNHLKQYARDVDGLTHFLTYADNNAVGYFVKQGFTKEIGMNKDRWLGYIKDYDGGTLMECKIDPKLPYTDLSSMIRQQRMVLDAKIRKLSSCHMVYDGLDFRKKEAGVNTKAVKPEDIPGLREAGWTPDQYGHSRFDVLMNKDGGSNTKCLVAFMHSLLKTMLDHPDVWPFKEPVDAHDVPDYYTIIQNPMDLKTMSQRVESEQYPTFEMFIADAKRMFANARTYNSPETIFYKCAARLETYFLSKVQTGLQSLVKLPP